MKRYPKYKDSGIEWIGEIPEEWKISKIKFLAEYINGYAFKPTDWSDGGLKIIRIQNLTNSDASFNRYSGELEEKYRIEKGAILFSWSASLGIFVWDEQDAWLNQHIFKVIPYKSVIVKKFYFYQAKWFTEILEKSVHGSTMQHLTKDNFGGFEVSLPPLPEQQTIANYLDRKTHLVDTLIENKQKLIDLLKEQRAAIINQAVTKGLNPNVKLKDSDIEWLGEIPEHWELRKVGRSFNLIGSGTTPKSENIGYYENGTINWVITGDLNDGILDKTSKKITEKALDEYSTLKIYPVGTLLIAMYGATIGKISLMNFEGCVNQACCALSDSPYLSNEFSFYWFLANKQHIINMSFGGGQPNISQEVVRSLKIPTPPSSEQQAIIYHLDEQTTRIDKLMERQGRQIERLKEYRTTLISEVVTGKIDVRDSGIQEVIHTRTKQN
jgi:type I restriction enzyme S subunit